jgi:valyl-tRNA synthetase
MESQGRDIKLDEKRIEGYRNFATKLWNAARFCQANGIGGSHAIEPPAASLPVNRWIVGETVRPFRRSTSPWPSFASTRARTPSTISSGRPSATGIWS